jgi:hypothetical protein
MLPLKAYLMVAEAPDRPTGCREPPQGRRYVPGQAWVGWECGRTRSDAPSTLTAGAARPGAAGYSPADARRRDRRPALLVVVAGPEHAAPVLVRPGRGERALGRHRVPAGHAGRRRRAVDAAPARPRADPGGPPPRLAGPRHRRGGRGGGRPRAVARLAEPATRPGRHGARVADGSGADGRADPGPVRSAVPGRPRGGAVRPPAGPPAPPPGGPCRHRGGVPGRGRGRHP